MRNAHELLISTLHANVDDFPWVEVRTGQEMKVIQARPSDELMVLQMRAQPNFTGQRHKHFGFTFGLTTKGAWSHNPREFPYKPSGYVFEPIDELHRFINGPSLTEAHFITIGRVDYYDDDDDEEVVFSGTADTFVRRYLEKCEAANLPRPNVLS